MIKSSLGLEEQKYITSQAKAWFNTLMIDSGFVEMAYQMLIPSPEELAKSQGFEREANFWFPFVEDRIEALQRVVFHVMIRFSLLLTWIPFMLILLVPAVYDGLNTWKLKRLTFEYSSPVIHRYSIKGIVVILIGMIGLFILPFPLNPMIIPASFIFLCLFIGLALSNLQKRI